MSLKTLGNNFFLVFLLSFLSIPILSQEQTRSLIIADFDETIFNTHDPDEQIDGETQGIYQSGYVLVRVNHADLKPSNDDRTEFALESLPKEVFIPMQDYRRFKERFAKNATEPGSSLSQVVLSSGEKIYPSFYYFDENISLKRFRSDDGQNYLLDEFQKTRGLKDKAKSKRLTYYGIAWPALHLALTPHPENSKRPILDAAIATARGQSAQHFNELWMAIAESEKIENPLFPSFGVNALSHSRFDDIHYDQDLAEKKWKLVEEKLRELQRMPIAENALPRVHSANSKLKARKHYLPIYEDNPLVFNYLLGKLRDEVRSQRINQIKVGLVCAASKFDYETYIVPPNLAGGISRFMILKPNGGSRPMLPIERIGEPILFGEEEKQARFNAEILEKFGDQCPLSFK